MRFRDSKSNVVLVGKWNPFVFSPEWVRQHLAHPDQAVSLAFPIGDPQAPIRITFGSTVLFPSNGRLEITTTAGPTPTGVDGLGDLARTILTLLPHTPIAAVGINFWLDETDSPESIFQSFVFSDAPRMSAERYALRETTISRSYALADDWVLNLQVGYTPTVAKVDFNFHLNVTGAIQAAEAIAATPCSARLAEAIAFIDTVYDLPVDTNSTHTSTVDA